IKAAEAADGPKHDRGCNHKRAGRVAQPPPDARRDEVVQFHMPGKVEAAGTDEGADQGARSEHDQRKFDDPGWRIEGSASLGPDVEQITAADCLERATRRSS